MENEQNTPDNATANNPEAAVTAPIKKTTRSRRATAATTSPAKTADAVAATLETPSAAITAAGTEPAPAKKAPVRRSRAKAKVDPTAALSTEATPESTGQTHAAETTPAPGRTAKTGAAKTGTAKATGAAKTRTASKGRAAKSTAAVTKPAVTSSASEEPSLLDGLATSEDAPQTAPVEVPAAPAKRTSRRRATSPVTAPVAVQGELSLAQPEAASDASTQAAPAPVNMNQDDGSAPEVLSEPKKNARRSRSAKAPAGKPVASDGAAATVSSNMSVSSAESTVSNDTPTVTTDQAATGQAPAKAPARRASRRAAAPVTSPRSEATSQADTHQDHAFQAENAAPEVPESPEAAAEAPAEAPRANRSRRRSSARVTTVTATNAGNPLAAETPGNTPAQAATSETGQASSTAESAVEPAATSATQPTSANESGTGSPTSGTETTGAQASESHVTESLFQSPASGISALFLAPDLSLAVPVAQVRDGAETASGSSTDRSNDAADSDAQDTDRRGRGRGRNRRTRNNDAGDTVDSAETPEMDDEQEENDGVTSRRRRRRRRGDADLELTGGSENDPPNTVTRVRAPRPSSESASTASDRVTSLRGSTRLEAKKQRRRDSRDSGRRRTVITEAEFLARRESVDRVMVVRQADDRIQIGVLEDGILAEHFVSKTQQDSLIGNVYVGKVQNVLPSMEAAFVDIGRGRNAVLYAGEVDWDAANLNGQPRRIENALKSGDSVLVQVSKDPVGHKGARLTSQISLPGRYLVFVPGGSMTGISRKLPDVERNRLKRVLKDHLPENAGVIVRTAAEGASEEELTNDINRLRAQWEGITNRAESTKTLAPEMLYAEPDLTIKVVRDVFNEDFSKLIVSGEDAWDTIEAYVTYVAPDLLDRLEKWTKPEDIFTAHRIDEQINKALERKVFLPSGGSLVIDRTEAMTVVDVNTGKFTGSGGNLEETVTKNNLEAAEEVVRQLRLRDIGGIIVIDFIDMVLESNRDLVLRRLVECLGRDRTKHQVAEVTSLGLVQMTRKRMGTGLLEVFGELCPSCAGRGMVTHEIPVEHRRTHSPAVEVAHAHAVKHDPRETERTANRSTRSERKRNRNRSQQTESEQLAEQAPVNDEAAEAAKAQKAHEARAALAAIAAAAAASHHGNDAEHSAAAVAAPAARDQQGDGDSRVAQEGSDLAEREDTADGATLTLGGEAIELPRGHRSESTAFTETHNADQVAALAHLAQALDQLSAPGSDEAHGASHESGSARAPRSRRARRNRSARSAQGSADTAVETSDSAASEQGNSGAGAAGAQASAGGETATQQSAAVERPAVAAAPAKRAEPIILGVGVPASEL